MNFAISSHIFFYVFIILVAGIGLYFSFRMEGESISYFWAYKSKKGISVGFSFILLIIFYSLIILFPDLSSEPFSLTLTVALIAAIVLPAVFGHSVFSSIAALFQKCNGMCSLLLSLHGLLFLCLVQVLLLLHVTDFVVQRYVGESSFSLLVSLIVIAGIYTIIGGLRAVLYINNIVTVLIMASIAFISFNVLFPTIQVFFSFKDTFQLGHDIFRSNGLFESNSLFLLLGFMIMIFWLLWMEFGEMQRKISVRSELSLSNGVKLAAIVAPIILVIVLLTSNASSLQPDSQQGGPGNILNDFIGISFLAGLMGLFAVTYQSAGSIMALRLFPFFQTKKNDEEQILVGRLTIVVVVLLTIFLIPFAKISGDSILMWFINFLAFFVTPIVASFIVFALYKKGRHAGFISGVLLGETYAVVEYVFHTGILHNVFFTSSSSFAFCVDIFFVTIVVSILTTKAFELRFIQRNFPHSA